MLWSRFHPKEKSSGNHQDHFNGHLNNQKKHDEKRNDVAHGIGRIGSFTRGIKMRSQAVKVYHFCLR